MSTLTRGPRIVREQIMKLMEARFPDALEVFRAEWGLKIAELPPPVRYDRYEASTLDVLPVLALTVSRAREFTRRDPVATEYQVRYSCRVFGWVKHQERDPTEAIRDDYATVLTSVLLADQGLLGGGAFRVEETGLEVSYSDVARVRGDRYVSGCSVSFDVFHDETVRRVPIGTTDALTLAVSVLPEHPAL